MAIGMSILMIRPLSSPFSHRPLLLSPHRDQPPRLRPMVRELLPAVLETAACGLKTSRTSRPLWRSPITTPIRERRSFPDGLPWNLASGHA
jgi:hypothetical protein